MSRSRKFLITVNYLLFSRCAKITRQKLDKGEWGICNVTIDTKRIKVVYPKALEATIEAKLNQSGLLALKD